MGLCIQRRLSTEELWGKRGTGKGERTPVALPVALFPFPFPLYPIPLILLDVVSVNPRALLCAIASFKHDVLIVFSRQKVYASVDIFV